MTVEKIKVLIIEDNPRDTRLMEHYLSEHSSLSFDITKTLTMVDATDIVIKNSFDLIFLDLGSPDGTGLNTINRISQIKKNAAIVVLTDVYEPSLASKAINHGAHDFIVKNDVNVQLFEGTINVALYRNHMESDLQKTKETFKAIIDTANDAIITMDNQLMILSWNRAAKNIFGYQEEDMIGKPIFILFEQKEHAELSNKFSKIWHSSNSNVPRLIELSAVNRLGQIIPVELSVATWLTGRKWSCSLVVRDISERRKMELIKSEFISIVSHELRTPLTGLLVSLKLILDGFTGEVNEQTTDLVNRAHISGDRLLVLVSDLLDLNKLDDGKMKLNIEEVNISGVVDEAVVENKGYADSFQVNYTIGKIKPNIVLKLDRIRLLQILANFLSNAAKFSPVDGNIVVDVSEQENHFRLSVTDKGPGITEEFKSCIFNKFSQSDSSTTRSIGGTGLGLYISKKLAENMGGTVGFTSEPHVATSFYIDFPKTLAVTGEQFPVSKELESLDESNLLKYE